MFYPRSRGGQCANAAGQKMARNGWEIAKKWRRRSPRKHEAKMWVVVINTEGRRMSDKDDRASRGNRKGDFYRTATSNSNIRPGDISACQA